MKLLTLLHLHARSNDASASATALLLGSICLSPLSGSLTVCICAEVNRAEWRRRMGTTDDGGREEPSARGGLLFIEAKGQAKWRSFGLIFR